MITLKCLSTPLLFQMSQMENDVLGVPIFDVVVVVVVLLFYVHGKHLRSCRDGQLT